MRSTYGVTTPHKSYIIRCLTDYDYRLSKPELTLSSFYIFWHIISLAYSAAAVYISHDDDFPIFEPDMKALWRARDLRDTDGDGVQKIPTSS